MEVIAVTDHDTVEGVAEAQLAGRPLGLEVIPGVEINTDVPGSEVHVLGYFVDLEHAELKSELQRLRFGRVGRAERMVQKLNALGAPVEWARVQQIAGEGSIGRPHVAQALMEAGHVGSFSEAFDRYIGRQGPAYVERLKFTPEDACRLIRRAGGVPVLAHPVIFGKGGVPKGPLDLDRMIVSLVEAGLLGIELYYPGYDPATVDYLLGIARRHNLIRTGGSDFHGAPSERPDLGSVYVPLKVVRNLRAAWEYAEQQPV